MSLIDLLLGGSQGATQAGAAAPPQVPITPQQQDPQAPITVQGDTWHPSSPGWLGKALDTILMLKGKQPVFQGRKAQEDLNKVMPDYNSDPLQTIHRVAEIPGMANKAQSMYEQYSTDQERNQSRDIRDAAKKDLLRQRLGGIAGVTTPQNFDKSRQLMLDYVKNWGGDPADYDIPTAYDKDALDLMSGGTITAKDQAAQQQREQAITQRATAAEYLKTYREERLGQLGRGLDQREQSIKDREDNFNKLHPPTKVIDTPQGKMELSPSGLTGRIGNQVWQKAEGNQWKRVN